MKKHIYFFLFALFVSCTPVVEELDKPFLEGQEVTISATIAEQRPQMLPGMQRVSGKDTDPTNPNKGTIHLTWDKGDSILVKIGDKSSVFTLTSGADTGSGTFTGIMPAEGASFYVQYPTNIPILAEQQYVKDGFGKDLMLMTTKQAASVSSGFVLSADYALLGLQLTGDRGIGKIVLSKNNADGKAGDETYTLHCPEVTLSATPTLFYFVVLPNTWANGFTVEVFGSDNSTIVDTFVKTTSITFGTTNATVMPTKPVQCSAKRIGVFSVAEDKQVSFSQGNLQYIQSANLWRFADNQLYHTGERHLQNDQIADTVMYFGWSAKDSKAPWGISTSTNLEDYKGEFLDWGTNTIQGDKPNTWRSMSNDEWVYLFSERKNASQLIGRGEVNAINGIIILPDDWMAPKDILFAPIASTTINRYTSEQWSKMEDAGAVFIPASGYFNNKLTPKMRFVNERVYASSSSLYNSDLQIYCRFTDIDFEYSIADISASNLHYAFPRRLVHDTVIPEYVDMGLSVKWANYNLGATTPTGVGDYYAWGEIEPKDSYTTANYQWANGPNALTKYCTVDSMGYNGFTDGLTTLQAQDDAAQMQKGGHWRMPSDAEWEELRKNCIWTQAEQGGQIGYLATSKINGNRIFIPVAGFRSGGNVVLDYLGAYWSSTLNEAKQSCAYGLYINKDEDRVGKYSNSTRSNGFLIRPVYDENYHAYID